jgi:periplasmic protein TonB
MKRKKEEVPGFDEIIFENRNKAYGAYDLRRRYDSTTSISILGGITLGALLLAAFTLKTEDGDASNGPTVVTIVMTDPVISPVAPPDIKPPEALTAAIKNLQPQVTNDTSELMTMLPPNDELVLTVRNGDLKDTIKYIETEDQVLPDEQQPKIIVQEMPEFPGGTQALMNFINENISYPEDAIRNNIQGKVILKFVVNTDGSVDRVEILGGIDPSLNNEAIRVVKNLPRFKPGKDNGVPVPVWFTLPVIFRLEGI